MHFGSRHSMFAIGAFAFLSLVFSPSQADVAVAETACADEISCDATNRWGAHFVEVNDVVWEGDCVVQYDCLYDDGYQTRHIY